MLVSGAATGISMLAVALLGIPILVGLWFAARGFAAVERVAANRLLDVHIAGVPAASGRHGNLWTRLRSMSSDGDRWREIGFLFARFPVGIATFTATAVALTVPVAVAAAPFTARHGDEPFGDWALSATLEDVASYPTWSWLFVPLGAALLIGALHLLNWLARVCGRFAAAGLGAVR